MTAISKACELADELEQAFNTATGSVRLNTPKPYVLWWPNGHPTFIAVPQDRSYGHKEAQRDGQIVADFTLAGDKWAALFALIIKRMPAILERLRTSPSPTREAVLEEAINAVRSRLNELTGDRRCDDEYRYELNEAISRIRALSPSPEPIVGQGGEKCLRDAAPELLEALVQTERLNAKGINHCTQAELDHAELLRRDAIAKATGGQHD